MSDWIRPASVRPMKLRRSRRIRLLIVSLFALVAGLLVDATPDLLARRVEQLAGPLTWSALEWESRALPAGLAGIVARAVAPPRVEEARATLAAYLQGTLPEAQWAALPTAIAVVVETELRRQGVPELAGLAFPPVAVVPAEPPRVLAVSPRHEIRLAYWVLLRGAMDPDTIEALERAVERLNLSALVERTGGISTYPVIAPFHADPQFTLETAVHEWAHTAFFFTPLGRAYGGSPEARAINETAADLIGREVADAIIRDLGVPRRPRAVATNGDGILAELRQIRVEVDRRLAAGDVAGAEAYMEAQRRELEARGYRIRRLNQAFFAFHGNYAEGPAASTEVQDSLTALRNRSRSLGEFIGRVGRLTSLADLRTEVGREVGRARRAPVPRQPDALPGEIRHREAEKEARRAVPPATEAHEPAGELAQRRADERAPARPGAPPHQRGGLHGHVAPLLRDELTGRPVAQVEQRLGEAPGRSVHLRKLMDELVLIVPCSVPPQESELQIRVPASTTDEAAKHDVEAGDPVRDGQALLVGGRQPRVRRGRRTDLCGKRR